MVKRSRRVKFGFDFWMITINLRDPDSLNRRRLIAFYGTHPLPAWLGEGS